MIFGFKPYPSYKPSGVEWLGEVPEHWEVRKIKDWLLVNRFNISDDTNPNYTFDYLDIGSVGTGQLVSNPQRITFRQSPSRARRIVHEKDTIVSTVRTYLKAVWYACGIEHDLVASTGFAVLTAVSSSNPKFVNYMCQSNAFTDQVSANSSGIVYPAISEAKFATLKVTAPPLPEQITIADFLDHETALIDRLIEKKQKLLELLQEYRTRLIADAVTGKIDVREALAELQQTNSATCGDETNSTLSEQHSMNTRSNHEHEENP
ncbi:MAG: restriction endonuclease subunit S [Gammaproteobacteria bacterium]|nr:restriction endonuclease subunit S [Gammaproteobacteria bacterium]